VLEKKIFLEISFLAQLPKKPTSVPPFIELLPGPLCSDLLRALFPRRSLKQENCMVK
jgi:hypothetical protein